MVIWVVGGGWWQKRGGRRLESWELLRTASPLLKDLDERCFYVSITVHARPHTGASLGRSCLDHNAADSHVHLFLRCRGHRPCPHALFFR